MPRSCILGYRRRLNGGLYPHSSAPEVVCGLVALSTGVHFIPPYRFHSCVREVYYGELSDVNLDNIIGPDLPLSMGIFLISFGGHAAFPQIYREMSKPGDFNRELDVCFLLMFIIYSITGVVGYMIYGSLSRIII